MPAVLFVCTANICRSPMAEGILKKLVATREDVQEWHIESAGTWAYFGNTAAPLSQLVMQMMGIDISAHHSQVVSPELLEQFDLILTMERSHKEGMTIQFSQFADRIYMLSEMVEVTQDISDPIGGDMEDYQETANNLMRFLSDGLDRIYQLTTSSKKLSKAKGEE